MANYQGNAVVNYTPLGRVPYTYVIEHKHFTFGQQEDRHHPGVPRPWQPGEEPYYPVNDGENQALLARYQQLAQSRPEVALWRPVGPPLLQYGPGHPRRLG